MPSSDHIVIDATRAAARTTPKGMLGRSTVAVAKIAKFRIESTVEGTFRFALLSAQSEALLTSNTMPTRAATEEAIAWVRRAVRDDWRYRITRSRTGGLHFLLVAPRLHLTCRSPAFPSGEMMEQAIRHLKDYASLAPIDGPLKASMQPHYA